MPRLLVETRVGTATMQEILDRKSTGVELRLEGGRVVSFAAQYRRCGKASCSGCPHGPYAYAVIGSGSDKRRIPLGALPASSPFAPARPKAKRVRSRKRP